MMPIEDKIKKLFVLLTEIKNIVDKSKMEINKNDTNKIRRLNLKYLTIVSGTFTNPLELMIDSCRQSYIAMPNSTKEMYNQLIDDAREKYNNIESKMIEKCIWKIGLEYGSVKEEDILTNRLDCLKRNCRGYDFNCKTHPQYKQYKAIKKSLNLAP